MAWRVGIELVAGHLRVGERPEAARARLGGGGSSVTERVWGVIRWRGALRWVLDPYVRRRPPPGLEACLLVGAYELLWGAAGAHHAAVFEPVAVARRQAGAAGARFVNGVLRSVQRGRAERLAALAGADLGVRYSHPDELIRRWLARWPVERVESLLHWNNTPARVVVRLRADLDPAAYQATAAECGQALESHPHPSGRFLYVPRGVAATELPGFAVGHVTIQDPGMFTPVALLDPQPGERILDACAAPGGKTGALAEAVGPAGHVLALDADGARLDRLRENLRRLGVGNVSIQGARVGDDEALALPDGAAPGFDAVLLDVPCSNTGVLRRRVDARWRFQAIRLRAFAATQARILDWAPRVLRPGGRLVYSTCSLEPEENQDQIRAWLARHPEFLLEAQIEQVPPADDLDGGYAARLVRGPGP
ncbi:MAG: methyltransferase domain-containing protein [Candidatus Marinimicrobia bacterium]|nr:methyltransferase domain-containing protein [Candidatus Neomarinimicrobiota bacterium]